MTGWSFFYSQYRTEEVDLRGSTFPIIFKICVSPAFDKEALINMGYTKFSHYFQASIIDFLYFVFLFQLLFHLLFFLVPTGLDSFESEAKSGTSVCRNSENAFSQGISAHNSSLAGWGGHLSNGGVKASVKEVLDAVIINKPSEVRL